jgi:hypothetical protein
MDSAGSKQDPVTGVCGNDNGPSHFIQQEIG